MPTGKNYRIFYAVQQVGIRPDGAATWQTNHVAHGVQSVGITTNFNLSQAFELGQISIYENIEEIPDVEVSMTKVLDGNLPLYLMATTGTDVTASLVGRSNRKCIFGLSIFRDTADSATGAPEQQLECSGMYVSSISYNFPLEDNFSEDVTLVGNHKSWGNATTWGNSSIQSYTGGGNFDGGFEGNNDAPPGSGGVNRRQDLLMATGWNNEKVKGAEPHTTGLNGFHNYVDVCCFPTDVPGITGAGALKGMMTKDDGSNFDAHISSLSVSTDLGREQILELGRKAPYYRYATFPVEVSCEIEVTSTSGDLISATEEGVLTKSSQPGADLGNLEDQTIRIATAEGLRISLGAKNKLASVNYGGGDAGGGNSTVTYSYTNFNDMTVLHSGEGTSVWAARNAAGTLWVSGSHPG